MMRALQDGALVYKTFHVKQEGPANALATNKDFSQVVIAGRSVFKIFSIEDYSFVERANLRVGKANLNYSCNDVAWNTMEDSLLATAATNGAVVLWNLNKSSRSKQEALFQDHNRTVNKVSFHPTEPNFLISGSQDGTMMCFDIRKKEAASVFQSNSESVRDVQFNPHQCFIFMAVSENGIVQLWDMRRPDKCEKYFTAHSGPVFACDWHPELKNWVATAGRDKSIKVWDVTVKPVLKHTVQTIASVGRIRWRPQSKHHIASAALVVDCNVNIWDIRRPCVPFASFNEHKDVTTGIVWRGDPNVLLSTSKDSTLYQHVFKDAIRSKCFPVGISNNVQGDFYCTYREDRLAGASVQKFPFFSRRNVNAAEQFVQANSTFLLFQESSVDNNWLVESAKNYLLQGKSFNEICDQNACVAMKFNRPQVSFSWEIIKHLFKTHPTYNSQKASIPVKSNDGEHINLENEEQKSLRHLSGNDKVDADEKGLVSNIGASEDESETDDQENSMETLAHIASGTAGNQDFFFGDGDADHMQYEYELGGLEQTQDWILPNEAFHPRHEIRNRSPPPEQFPYDEDLFDATNREESDETPCEQNLLDSMSALEIPFSSNVNIVLSMLKQYAADGEIQTAVSIMLVLGDQLKGLIDEDLQQQWCLSYIDLLHKFELWNIATQVISLSCLPLINEMNQQSTTVYTNCPRCYKILGNGWHCSKCNKITNTCSVCHKVVYGMYAWCQGCAHGGHLKHLTNWFSANSFCPTGCGHKCEYN